MKLAKFLFNYIWGGFTKSIYRRQLCTWVSTQCSIQRVHWELVLCPISYATMQGWHLLVLVSKRESRHRRIDWVKGMWQSSTRLKYLRCTIFFVTKSLEKHPLVTIQDNSKVYQLTSLERRASMLRSILGFTVDNFIERNCKIRN